MIKKIQKWIEDYYKNDYKFDDKKFVEIINELVPIISGFTKEEQEYVLNIINMAMQKYEIKDYYYTVEIIEYELLPLFSEE